MTIGLVVVARDGSESEVEIEGPADATIGDLTAALSDRLGVAGRHLYLLRTSAWLEQGSPWNQAGLLHGDRVSVGEPNDLPADAISTSEEPALELVVVGGVNIGMRSALTPGALRVGRGRECDIRIDDPALSRIHLVLQVSDGTVTVSDAGSTNGTFLNGVRLEDDHRWTPGEVIEAGGSLLGLELGSGTRPADVPPTSEGRLPFNRPPRVTTPEPRLVFQVPQAPAVGAGPR
ncbi:MAG: FHA domain-containing protein [Actinomycetota bacterium]